MSTVLFQFGWAMDCGLPQIAVTGMPTRLSARLPVGRLLGGRVTNQSTVFSTVVPLALSSSETVSKWP